MCRFKRIWFVDFEFRQPDGARPHPHCVVAKELFSGKVVRLWLGAGHLPTPPYEFGEDDLFVAYNASAEMLCHLVLKWGMPVNVLDLMVEFRWFTNGHPDYNIDELPGLTDALDYFGIPGVGKEYKKKMQNLAASKIDFTEEEILELLAYCETDVVAAERLFAKMQGQIDWNRALFRGRYMKVVACIEFIGTPTDVETLGLVKDNWDAIKRYVIDKVNQEFHVFTDEGKFSQALLEDLLRKRKIRNWPRTEKKKQLSISEETMEQMVKIYPDLQPLKSALGDFQSLKWKNPSVGEDGRNRFFLRPFRSITGRNQPSSTQALMYSDSWRRFFVKAPDGYGLISLDFDQQEFGIAARLSGDKAMQRAYHHPIDPYIAFGIQIGMLPEGIKKEDCKPQRQILKGCVLGVQYGISEYGLARNLGIPRWQARKLLQQHREAFPDYWGWQEQVFNDFMITGYIQTPLGWRYRRHPRTKINERTIKNFLMQATAGDILRVACVMVVERGYYLCVPVHDSLLILAKLGELEATAKKCQSLMVEAGRAVLGGFDLKVSYDLFPDLQKGYSTRYFDERGLKIWSLVQEALDKM